MLAVIIGAVRLLATGRVLARLDFQEVRVILLFLPAMRVQALILICAALLVRTYKVVDLPLRTHLATVQKDGGSASIVLPVVCIDANFTIMVILTVRAPHSLEMEHIEVHVDIELLDQLY